MTTEQRPGDPALLPWYAEFFDQDVLARARRRLEDHGFDVEDYLASAATSPPAWSTEPDQG